MIAGNYLLKLINFIKATSIELEKEKVASDLLERRKALKDEDEELYAAIFCRMDTQSSKSVTAIEQIVHAKLGLTPESY